ncbi:MAG: hypothetical protein ACT6U0_26015 [Shinella sp.]
MTVNARIAHFSFDPLKTGDIETPRSEGAMMSGRKPPWQRGF